MVVFYVLANANDFSCRNQQNLKALMNAHPIFKKMSQIFFSLNDKSVEAAAVVHCLKSHLEHSPRFVYITLTVSTHV